MSTVLADKEIPILRLAESDFCAESKREHQNKLALYLIDVAS